MPRAVYFDESGFTGRALLDPQQPLFCIASSIIAEKNAEEILRSAFPRYAADEFKFQHIWRRESTRATLSRFASLLSEVVDDIFLWVIDKRFCVLTKLIDFLIEPVLHDLGYDFYADGFAPKFSNHVHFGLTVICAPELYVATTDAYYRFTRDPTFARLSDLQWYLGVLANSAPEDVRFFYELAAVGAARFHEFHNIESFSDTFEVQLTSVLASVGYWRHKLPDELELFHDQSSNFFKQNEVWQAITADDVPPQFHPQANAPPIEFPLRVNKTVALDSKSSFAIQLCDVVAGLAVKVKRVTDGSPDGDVCREVMAAGFAEITFNGIRPELQVLDGPPKPLKGADVVDKLLSIIKPQGRRP